MLPIQFRYIESFLTNCDLKKKVKKIWTSNIYELLITHVIVGHTELIFFHFPIFFTKTNQQNELKFLQIIAIYILDFHNFFPKNLSFSLRGISFFKKHAFVNNKRAVIARNFREKQFWENRKFEIKQNASAQ